MKFETGPALGGPPARAGVEVILSVKYISVCQMPTLLEILEKLMPRSIQLTATVGLGSTITPEVVSPDGTQNLFSIPPGAVFIATDISIQRTGVTPGMGLYNLSILQIAPTSSHIRWAFVGELSGNFERTFTSGIVFSTPFVVENGVQSADVVTVRLWGFFEAWR